MNDVLDTKSRPRDRIIATARELFRKHGIRGVGVDTIAEAAGTNKMTLYRHFGSKDELIVACLHDLARQAEAKWASLEAMHPDDPLARLHAWIAIGAVCAVARDRGCDFANIAVELAEEDHPAREVIAAFKRVQRERLVGLCREAGAATPDLLADTLFLLIEGARVSRQSTGPDGPGAQFMRTAEAVVALFRSGHEAAATAEAAAAALARGALPAHA